MTVTKKAEGIWWLIAGIFFYTFTKVYPIEFEPSFLVTLLCVFVWRISRWK